MFRCCAGVSKQGPSQDSESKTKHLSCPRCRRLLIVPNVDTFRCHCSLIFRVSGTAEGTMQLCFSLSDQEAHGQGHGLPRKLVERMPVTTVTVDHSVEDEPKPGDAEPGRDQPAPHTSIDDDQRTCRICLSSYKVGDSVRVLPCFHRFHVDEIDDWLDRNTSCPLCHLDISKALTGSSAVAFVSVMEGNPVPVIERSRR
ncbi:unnamed protein product [Scytosiphon promiscuus]